MRIANPWTRAPWGLAVVAVALIAVVSYALGADNIEPEIHGGEPVSPWAASSVASTSEAKALLVKMSHGPDRPFKVRQLVAQLSDPQSVAVIEVSVDKDQRIIESKGGELSFTIAGSGLDVERVDSKYELSVSRPGPVMGQDLVAIDLIRRFDGRRTERLYIDESTGLVHRKEIWGPDGILGMTTILDVEWDIAPARRAAKSLSVVSDDLLPATLAYGYTRVSSHRADGGMQSVYFDGLHSLSVFRNPGLISKPEGYEQISSGVWRGPGPGTWTWQGGDESFVIVAEESQLEIAKLSEDLPTAGPSLKTRMGSWWSKLGDALSSN